MELKWTSKALGDLVRLFEFLSGVDRDAAARTVRTLADAPSRLAAHPRVGERIEEFSPREVRGLLVGRYELRYEITESTIAVLRIWHTREERS